MSETEDPVGPSNAREVDQSSPLALRDALDNQILSSFYKLFGIEAGADSDAIRKAYDSLRDRYDPERNSGDPLADEIVGYIDRAYLVLIAEAQPRTFDSSNRQTSSPAISGGNARKLTL
jgi:DnaJ-class molecular chaperone